MGQPGDIEETSEPTFQGPVSVGKGVYFSGRRGTLTIDEGDLTLCKRDGSVIAQAPTSDVWVAKGFDSVKVWVGDKRFILRPAMALRLQPRYKQFNAFAAIILAVSEAEGAHIGKPGSTGTTGGEQPS